jgi:hypothetical protein
MRKLSSIFLAVILMLAASSTAQVARGQTQRASVKVKPNNQEGIYDISGSLTPGGWTTPPYGPWSGGLKLIQVEVHWAPSYVKVTVVFEDTNIPCYYSFTKTGGDQICTLLVPASEAYDSWIMTIGNDEPQGGSTINYYGTIYVVWGQ